MPYIFSEKQINHAYHLLTEHHMNVSQVAEIMGTNIRNTHHLIRCVWQKYPKPNKIITGPALVQKKKHCSKIIHSKHIKVIEEIIAPFKRPKAEYSNRRMYDLI